MNNGKLILIFMKRFRWMLLGEFVFLTLFSAILGWALGASSHTALVFHYRELVVIVSIAAGVLWWWVMSCIDKYVNGKSYHQWTEYKLQKAWWSHQRAVLAVLNCYNTKGTACGWRIFVRRVKRCRKKRQHYKALLHACGKLREAASFQRRCNQFEDEIKFIAKQYYGKEVV